MNPSRGKKVRIRPLATCALAAVWFVISVAPAWADLFIVNVTDDSDDGVCDLEHCSLREALQLAEMTEGQDQVSFIIPPFDVERHTIRPGSPLPAQTDPAGVRITAVSQPGTSFRVQFPSPFGLSGARVIIEIDGSLAGENSDGLVLAGGPSTIVGLAVTRFDGNGIVLAGGGAHLVDGALVGLDPSGRSAGSNGGDGIRVTAPDCRVDRSGIAANGGHGIHLASGGSRTLVHRNIIGTGIDGDERLGNLGAGVAVFTDGNQIGGASGPTNRLTGNAVGLLLSGPGARGNDVRNNSIDANHGDGVLLTEGANDNYLATRILGATNQIYWNGGNGVRLSASAGSSNPVIPYRIGENGGLAIDLEGGVEDGDGVTANDPGDADGGPNDLQNAPVLLGVEPCAFQSSSVFCVGVELSGRPHAQQVVALYAGSTCTGPGRGLVQFENREAVFTLDGAGYHRGTLSVVRRSLFAGPGGYLTALQVEFPSGNSSELSNCLEAQQGEIQVPGHGTPTPTWTPRPPASPSRSLPRPTRVESGPTSTPTPMPLPSATMGPRRGDANCDGRVTVADLPAAIALRAAGSVACSADVDGDGAIDERDLLGLIDAIFAP